MTRLTFRLVLLFLSVVCISLQFDTIVQARTLTISAQTSSAIKMYEQGLQYFKTQEYHQAIETLLKLLEIEPNNFQAYHTIGMSLGELQEYPTAVAAFDRAIALNKDFANAYYHRGYVYQQLNRHHLALTDFNQVLELTQGQHISALINRSSIYAMHENYQLALADLQQVVNLNPEEATAYYNRALIHLTMGNKPAYLDDLAIAEKLYRQLGDMSGLAQIDLIKEYY